LRTIARRIGDLVYAVYGARGGTRTAHLRGFDGGSAASKVDRRPHHGRRRGGAGAGERR
jgi:hypothetical protein